MSAESIVYGCIHDWPSAEPGESARRRTSNRRVIDALPQADGWTFIGRDMFGCAGAPDAGLYQTQIIHFGASYRQVEYEWSLWVAEFEQLLRRLYWTRAVVHLQTELSGTHTFRWEAEEGAHGPGERPLRLRCAWERESDLLG
ncbi:hypothetical protein HKW98_05390 [Stutzerimonas urumqiensis]|uniref:hypothetical protein n=1 Tax=Stutzerimonas urumqiensis TaxID=638269 RepID=UPI003BACAC24